MRRIDMPDELDDLLGQQRYLIGDTPTAAEWRLFTSLMRCDHVCHGHPECNRRRLIDTARDHMVIQAR